MDVLETLLSAQLQVLESLPAQATGDQVQKEPLRQGARLEHAAGSLLISASLDGFGDESNPFVKQTVSETAERFAKGHVANYVEGREV